MKKILMLGILMGLSGLTGCVHYTKPMDPADKKVEIEQGKALVVMYASTQLGTNPMFLMDGEKPVTMIYGGRQKVFYQAEPGKHLLAVATDNFLPFGGFDFVFLEGEIKAGEVYYIAADTYQVPFTGFHLNVAHSTMVDISKKEFAKNDGLMAWLLLDKLHYITDEGFAYFEDEKKDLLPRYRDQLKDARDDGEVIQLHASDENKTKIVLHNGKYM